MFSKVQKFLLEGKSSKVEKAHHLPAFQVLELRRRFPRTSVAVALEVLRRNDEDPHAACEMLEEFRQRIRRNVTEEWDQYLLQGEEGELFFFWGGGWFEDGLVWRNNDSQEAGSFDWIDFFD